MSKSFVVKCGIYPFDVLVSVAQTDAALRRALHVRGVDSGFEDAFTMSETVDARFLMDESGKSLIRFKHVLDDHARMQSVIAHESLHATHHILNRVGISLVPESEEAFTYLLGYLVEQINKRIYEYTAV